MSSDTPTPRTEQFIRDPNNWHHSGFCDGVDCARARESTANFASQLERELAEYRAATDPHYVDELAEARADSIALQAWHSQFGTSQLSHAIAERDALKAENAKWREILKALCYVAIVHHENGTVGVVCPTAYEPIVKSAFNELQALASRGSENQKLRHDDGNK